ncbi:beta-casp domain-containing protein [Marinobacter nauticus]|uniref:Beta-casp domain-containing protein n=1 Tax=Marinobacter nauticus TaxID=2743 RepID=A0A368URD8_MARNT|nr:beta-casp domain-containing protein [Marinobacter nauticus]RCW30715.1 beta-casp domain-containing protein [Marinobacter nauticus]
MCESTYGDRTHGETDPEKDLEEIITKTAGRGGIVLIPAFAVGRAQMLLYVVHKLMGQGRIPKLPVYLNSPMAIKATEIFCKHHKEHKLNCARWRGLARIGRCGARSVRLGGTGLANRKLSF